MANSYASSTFVIDTDTNVAGLTALKGSASALTDDICIKSGATLTVESNLDFLSLNIGYGAINRGTVSTGKLVVSDNVVLRIAASGKVYQRGGCDWTMNGTLRSIGTSNGNADQTFTTLHENNTTIYIDSEPWLRVPDLTGRRVDVTATTNTTSITCTDNPSLAGIYYGQTIEIRTRADGTLKATKVVTAVTATSVSWASGNVSVDAGDAVYAVIGSTEKVYSISGTTVTFGDGTASAWNNSGGAIPANGKAVTQPGITYTCADLTTANQAKHQDGSGGPCVWSGVDMSGVSMAGSGTFAYNNCTRFTDCAIHQCAYGLVLYLCEDSTLLRCVAYRNDVNGFQIQNSYRATLTDCLSAHNLGPGFYLTYANGAFLQRCRGVYNQTYGFWARFGGDDITFCNCDATGNSYGSLQFSYCQQPTIKVLGCRTFAIAPSLSHVELTMAYRSELTGDAGAVLWRPSSLRPYASAYCGLGGTSAGLYQQNVWYTGKAEWIPGLTAYGATTIAVTTNGRTVETQYRVSHDYGQTWTAWASVPATITDTPDVNGEYIQFRCRVSDAGSAAAIHSGVSVACTFQTGWTAPTPSLPWLDYVGGLT